MHLYRVSSIPTLYGNHIQTPTCLTCSDKNTKPTSDLPIKLEKSWYDENDDVIDESVLIQDILPNKNEDSNINPEPSECLYHSVVFPETFSAKYVL